MGGHPVFKPCDTRESGTITFGASEQAIFKQDAAGTHDFRLEYGTNSLTSEQGLSIKSKAGDTLAFVNNSDHDVGFGSYNALEGFDIISVLPGVSHVNNSGGQFTTWGTFGIGETFQQATRSQYINGQWEFKNYQNNHFEFLDNNDNVVLRILDDTVYIDNVYSLNSLVDIRLNEGSNSVLGVSVPGSALNALEVFYDTHTTLSSLKSKLELQNDAATQGVIFRDENDFLIGEIVRESGESWGGISDSNNAGQWYADYIFPWSASGLNLLSFAGASGTAVYVGNYDTPTSGKLVSFGYGGGSNSIWSTVWNELAYMDYQGFMVPDGIAVKFLSQNSMPTPRTNEIILWEDADGTPDYYIVASFNGTVKSVQLS